MHMTNFFLHICECAHAFVNVPISATCNIYIYMPTNIGHSGYILQTPERILSVRHNIIHNMQICVWFRGVSYTLARIFSLTKSILPRIVPNVLRKHDYSWLDQGTAMLWTGQVDWVTPMNCQHYFVKNDFATCGTFSFWSLIPVELVNDPIAQYGGLQWSPASGKLCRMKFADHILYHFLWNP